MDFDAKKLKETITLLNKKLTGFKNEGQRLFATSSFQTQSVPLLHILGTHFPEVAILFIDTGFLFPETYAFKEKLQAEFGLHVITLKSEVSLNKQRDRETGLFQYALDPDYCCYINKVKPLEDFLDSGDVWISGVRRDQTSVREAMSIQEENKNGVIKLHPMLEWANRDIYRYIKTFDLPKHPLENEGYVSIGCVPCTHKWNGGDERGGRWVGSKKAECGLHTG
jgi:phosphoadenosine phosphosulfate reductase